MSLHRPVCPLLGLALVLGGCFEAARDPSLPGEDPPELGSWSEALAQAELAYELAETGVLQTDLLEVELPPEQSFRQAEGSFEQPAVRKAAALSNLILGLKSACTLYFADLVAHCEAQAAAKEVECPETPYDDQTGEELSCETYEERVREYERLTCLGNETEVAPNIDDGAAEAQRVAAYVAAEMHQLDEDEGLATELALVQALAENMLNAGAAPPYRDWGMGDPRNGGFAGEAAADADGMGGGLGATPGGAQDIGFIRTVVEEGYVPFPFHLAVEGLLSEHDLPLTGAPCDQLLCIKTGLGVAPTLDAGVRSAFVQLGFSSGLTMETFRRADLNLVVVLDKSGSMRDSGTENAAKMGAVKEGLHRMIDKLGPDDRLSVVLFNGEAETLLDSTPVTDRDALHAVVDTIEPGGGTNIEAGLRRGYEIAAANRAPGARLDRVMLLTDALPNVGRTAESEFLTLIDTYAAQGIGLSTFGVGLNFGQELVLEICDRRGGNYFFLEDAAKIEEVFTEDFDFLVTPLAYDLHLDVVPAPGYRVADVFGIRDWADDPTGVTMDVKTIFLSRNRGAIVLRLEPDGSGPM